MPNALPIPAKPDVCVKCVRITSDQNPEGRSAKPPPVEGGEKKIRLLPQSCQDNHFLVLSVLDFESNAGFADELTESRTAARSCKNTDEIPLTIGCRQLSSTQQPTHIL